MVKRRRKLGIWIFLLIILGVVAVISVVGVLLSAPGRKEVAKLTISDIDFTKLHDGIYVGDYTGIKDHLRDAKVQVTITGGQISNITILKGALDKNGKPAVLQGGLSIGDLFGNVLKQRTLQVDTICGATLTSKAHLKALENALEQAEAE